MGRRVLLIEQMKMKELDACIRKVNNRRKHLDKKETEYSDRIKDYLYNALVINADKSCQNYLLFKELTK